ncbi:hypothetical protein UPYG_G00307440 [Umbra pygmaea]|uniref:Uncharacterized protein n=1 Tax=Umbra pygmaea TaxID=75934 RepID=A0ABD0W3J3_UMBPY
MAATWRTGVGMVLVSSAVSVSASTAGLTEPLICYILDGVLLVYCIVTTVLFFTVKWCKQPTEPPIEDTYAQLKPGDKDEYEDLTKTAATRRKRAPEASSDTYQALQVTEDASDAYQVIATKGKGRKKKSKVPQPPNEEIQASESPPPLPPH